MPEDLVHGYKVLGVLGRGSFGQVLLVSKGDQGDERFAVKRIRLNASLPAEYVTAEISNHSWLCHPHVVRFHGVFRTTRSVNIVMEYCDGGNLFDYVQARGRLSDNRARWFFQQLTMAVDYCHHMDVALRDIKLENVLLCNTFPGKPPLLKICDFGFSKHMHTNHETSSRVGSFVYMPPEVLVGEQYSPWARDIWSCGVLLYAMLVGSYPFLGGSSCGGPRIGGVLERLRHMREGMVYLPPSLSPACVHLIKRMLDPNPATRITMAQIKAHPWFLSDLPEDALAMNDRFLPHPVKLVAAQRGACLPSREDSSSSREPSSSMSDASGVSCDST